MNMLVLVGVVSIVAFVAVLAFFRFSRGRTGKTLSRSRKAGARDTTTGLANRQGLLEAGAQLRLRAGDRMLAAIVLDVGPHATAGALGDFAPGIAAMLPLGAVAGIVAPTRLACLMTFDRYAVDAPEQLARRIADALAGHAEPDARTATVGLASTDDPQSQSAESLVEAAATAAAAARAEGVRSLRFTKEMAARARARDAIAHSLPEAISSGAIVPYFEPIIELETNELLGLEVLARWEHPTHGVIAPAHFIDIAQERNLIADLTLSVMRQALTAARDWDHRLILAVNFSVTQLRDPWLAQKVIRLLSELGFPPARLEIELTEGVLMDPQGVVSPIVDSLKAQGVRIVLDDFGTGVSSLTHLRALPFDRIKIDHTIITEVCEDPARAAIADAVIRLGESLNLPVTAEGVESRRIADRLRGMGCTVGQGYLFGQPMSLMQTRRMLAEQRLIPTVVTNQRLAG